MHNLIPALAGGDFPALVDFKRDFFAKVRYIIRVVPLDRDAAAVDKAIETQRCAQGRDLFDDLLHLSIRQWEIVQTVNAAIILKQNIGPVAD